MSDAAPAPVDHRAKANAFMAEAEACTAVTGGGCCRGKARAKVELASELYVKAANSFKMAKDWQMAGNAFSESAAMQLKCDRKTEAGMHFVDAAKCYKKVNPLEAERCLIQAADVYQDAGRPRVAAKHILTLAEMFEEQKDFAKAVTNFQKAADLFSGEESGASTTKCLLGVATHGATLGNYSRSEELYVQMGKAALSSNLLKYTATDHFLRAGLCHLAAAPTDADGLRGKLNEWRDASPAFADSRDGLLLENLAEAVRKQDVDEFNEAIRSHESVNKLSEWHTEMLRRVRKHLAPDLR